jgi:hypothetical protein
MFGAGIGSGGSSAASYQVKTQARCLVALEGDTDRNRFVAASLDLRGDNELHVLEFNEDTNEVWCQHVFAHAHEVWHCAACPAPEHAEFVCTTYASGSEMRSKLWRMEGVAHGPGAPAETAPPVPAAVALPEVAEVGDPVPLREHLGVIWNAVLPEQIVSLTKGRLGLATLTHGARASTVAETASAAPPVEGSSFTCGRWDPHHAHSLGVGCGGSIVSLDTRTMKSAVRAMPKPKRTRSHRGPETALSLTAPLVPERLVALQHTVSEAHSQRVRGLDYNPNRPYILLSCADDYALR